MSKIEVCGDIDVAKLQEILALHYGDSLEVLISKNGAEVAAAGQLILREIKNEPKSPLVGTETPGLNDNAKLEVEAAAKLKATERKLEKATASIQSFHKQQKALFDEFVLLRQRYDEQKQALTEVLWLQCARNHPDLRLIPDCEDSEYIESEDRVGRYDIIDVLGEGQFATVKSCCMPEFPDNELALKVIKKDQISSFVALRRVSNEIGTLKRLSSPFVVRITDVIHTAENLYIVTEKGGLDLFAFFDEHPDGVSSDWAREIVGNILKAVLFCHNQGICHRDLKPENILLIFDEENAKCSDLKLCDFGLSTNYNVTTSAHSNEAMLSDFCGSPGFFAPEMITVGEYKGDKVDIWSVGCILLELVLGHQKFCDAWMSAYDFNILQDKSRFEEEITQAVQNLPGHLDFEDSLNSFIVSILTLNPTQRPGSEALRSHSYMVGFIIEHRRGGGAPLNLTRTQTLLTGAGFTDDPLSGLSNRERRMIEEYNLKAGNTEGGVNLPPIEPATPSLREARKILKKGEELASRAARGRFDSVDYGEDPLSPSTLGSPITVGGGESPNGRALIRQGSIELSIDENAELQS